MNAESGPRVWGRQGQLAGRMLLGWLGRRWLENQAKA